MVLWTHIPQRIDRNVVIAWLPGTGATVTICATGFLASMELSSRPPPNLCANFEDEKMPGDMDSSSSCSAVAAATGGVMASTSSSRWRLWAVDHTRHHHLFLCIFLFSIMGCLGWGLCRAQGCRKWDSTSSAGRYCYWFHNASRDTTAGDKNFDIISIRNKSLLRLDDRYSIETYSSGDDRILLFSHTTLFSAASRLQLAAVNRICIIIFFIHQFDSIFFICTDFICFNAVYRQMLQVCSSFCLFPWMAINADLIKIAVFFEVYLYL